MPLRITVGLSRKTTRNYQSRGCSVQIEAELDPALVHRPSLLQDQIADLYHEAELALDRQSGVVSPEDLEERRRSRSTSEPPAISSPSPSAANWRNSALM